MLPKFLKALLRKVPRNTATVTEVTNAKLGLVRFARVIGATNASLAFAQTHLEDLIEAGTPVKHATLQARTRMADLTPRMRSPAFPWEYAD